MNNPSLSGVNSQKTSRVLIWALVLAIVITLNLFFNYAISLIYKASTYDTFCPREQVTEPIENKDSCVAAGGAWSEYGADYYGKPVMTRPIIEGEKFPSGYCDPNFTCQKNFESANKVYNRNVFILLVVLGVASLASGFAFAIYGPVSLGLSLGGVLSLIIGSVRYWSDMQDILRVAILAGALIALIWIGIKKVKNQ